MTNQREHWGSRLGFILAAAGSAIGLGSLWRFPYIVGQNGGGAFVLLYLIFTVVIALPVFFAEIVIGRKSQKGAVMAYQELTHAESNWQMIGWINLATCLLITAFYSVVSGWSLSYIFMSLNQFYEGKSPEQIEAVFDVLFKSPGINLLFLFLFLMINIGILYAGVRKGIEKWSKILMPALFVMLFFLLIYNVFQPGFADAARFVFKPDFSKLNTSAVLNALGMSFFTLSAGLGIILTYGSYMKAEEDIPKTGLIITVMTLLVSLLGALIIFPTVFTHGLEPSAGPGLVFKTMPVIFAKIPGGLVLATIFFALVLFAALTSTISLIEVIIANFNEMTTWGRHKSTLVACGLIFIIGIPCALSGSNTIFPTWNLVYGKNFFDTLDFLTASWLMPLAGLLTAIFVGWATPKSLFIDEFKRGTKWLPLGHFSRFMIKWIAPIAVLLIILDQAGIINFNKLWT